MTILVDDEGVRIADDDDDGLEEGEIPVEQGEQGEGDEDDYDDEDDYEDEDEDDYEDDYEDEDSELFLEDDDDDMPHDSDSAALDLLESVMTTEDGDTVASALVNIGHQLETQNKILIKIFSALQA